MTFPNIGYLIPPCWETLCFLKGECVVAVVSHMPHGYLIPLCLDSLCILTFLAHGYDQLLEPCNFFLEIGLPNFNFENLYIYIYTYMYYLDSAHHPKALCHSQDDKTPCLHAMWWIKVSKFFPLHTNNELRTVSTHT